MKNKIIHKYIAKMFALLIIAVVLLSGCSNKNDISEDDNDMVLETDIEEKSAEDISIQEEAPPIDASMEELIASVETPTPTEENTLCVGMQRKSLMEQIRNV